MIALLLQLSRNGSNTHTEGSLLVAPRNLEQQTPAVSSSSSQERDFLAIARTTHTDKVEGHKNFKSCLEKGSPCVQTKFARETCRPWGHFYDTLYQRWLAPFSRDDTAPFQFLEIGFYTGSGFAAFQKFMPRAEAHSIELACLNDGKGFSLGNTAKKDRPALYDDLISRNRLHCGSATDLDFLDTVWGRAMRRADAPPLRVVVDDASHQAAHMVASVFYWFPKIEPGGLLVVEDIQPIAIANAFRTQFLPQVMSDLHWCGHPSHPEQAFFDTLWPLMKSISCEMHICVFERNEQPARHNLPRSELVAPPYALDYELALKTRKTPGSLK